MAPHRCRGWSPSPSLTSRSPLLPFSPWTPTGSRFSGWGMFMFRMRTMRSVPFSIAPRSGPTLITFTLWRSVARRRPGPWRSETSCETTLRLPRNTRTSNWRSRRTSRRVISVRARPMRRRRESSSSESLGWRGSKAIRVGRHRLCREARVTRRWRDKGEGVGVPSGAMARRGFLGRVSLCRAGTARRGRAPDSAAR